MFSNLLKLIDNRIESNCRDNYTFTENNVYKFKYDNSLQIVSRNF